MSIVINLSIIPQRISPDKWEEVYEESLALVQAYDFMDRIPTKRNGLEYCYAGKTKERDNLPKKGYRGWCSVGDMRTGDNTEDFVLYRDIHAYLSESKETDRGEDILLNALTGMDVPGKQKDCINLWGGRTQGEDSHIYLLAIGCLFASRFPEAAMVWGSISAGQCQRAVRWANQNLRTPIAKPSEKSIDEPDERSKEKTIEKSVTGEGGKLVENQTDKPAEKSDCKSSGPTIGLPDIGQKRKLLDRLKKSPILRHKLLDAFFQLTIEARDKRMGEFLEEEFHSKEIASYYKERLAEYNSSQRGFVAVIKEYLEMGFSFEGLCRLTVSDSDGPMVSPEEFLTHIMESGLYIEEKETEDITRLARERANCEKVDTEREEIVRILAKICGAENRNVNAYYPLEKIRQDCKTAFGNMCDVDNIIDCFLEKKTNNADKISLQKLLYDLPDSIFGYNEAEKDENGQKGHAYDVGAYRELINFVPGCSVRPELEADLIKNFKAIHEYAEAEFDNFKALSRKERENYFIFHNQYVLLRKNVWDRIFDRVMDDDYIIRIYGLFGINCENEEGYLFCRNVFANLQALDYYWELTLRKPEKALGKLEKALEKPENSF
ncbi:MAG: hypothetical protein NC400_00060 [Clostridium sp.]|nr:hypothetical protein [Clostridium sp.]